jgi:hypothetical protein
MNQRQQIEWIIEAIKEQRFWYDTCTKTELDNWEDKAAQASLDMDIALVILDHLKNK